MSFVKVDVIRCDYVLREGGKVKGCLGTVFENDARAGNWATVDGRRFPFEKKRVTNHICPTCLRAALRLELDAS